MFAKTVAVLLAIPALVFGYLIVNPANIVVGANLIKTIENGIERRTLQVDEHRWVYNTSGEGETLVLLHGFGASKESWNDLVPFLSSRYSIVVPDLPGFGESSLNSEGNYSVENQVIRLRDFLTALGLKNIHLAGNSMGGNIAASYAKQFSSEIVSLWLIAPAGVASASKSEFDLYFEKTGENVMTAGSIEELDRQLAWIYHKPPVMPTIIKRGIIDLLSKSSRFSQKLHKEFTTTMPAVEEILADFERPTLISWGENDRLTHVSGAKILQKVIPSSTLHLIPETGHVPMLEKPEEIASHYVSFHKRPGSNLEL